MYIFAIHKDGHTTLTNDQATMQWIKTHQTKEETIERLKAGGFVSWVIEWE